MDQHQQFQAVFEVGMRGRPACGRRAHVWNSCRNNLRRIGSQCGSRALVFSSCCGQRTNFSGSDDAALLCGISRGGCHWWLATATQTQWWPRGSLLATPYRAHTLFPTPISPRPRTHACTPWPSPVHSQFNSSPLPTHLVHLTLTSYHIDS